MFAPEGYTPLSKLWDEFIDANLDGFCVHATRYYQSDGFQPAFLRGGPLDIAEHVFTAKMCEFGIYASHSDGRVISLPTQKDDSNLYLFTQLDPYSSALHAAASEVENGGTHDVDHIAGFTFEAWEFEADNGDEWIGFYESLTEYPHSVPEEIASLLRFHSLPICYERRRFMIVEALPRWVPNSRECRDLEIIVQNFGGRALCVADTSLDRWAAVLSGEDLDLDGDESSIQQVWSQVGRPSKIPRVIEAYKAIFPNGHKPPWKRVANLIGVELGEPVSVQTIKRALEQMKEEAEQAD